MIFRGTLFLIGLIVLVSASFAMAEEITGNLTVNTTEVTGAIASNQSAPGTSSDEALMNLALDARAYALENGRMAAISAFSDKASFIKGGMYVTAYDLKGVLLADPYQSDKIGTSFIMNDHDAGLVRQLSDLAKSGGGILKPAESVGILYYTLDVDGSWWLVAVSGR
ncbi:MAG: hypothetical protein V1862_04465 [Methanobacteriota archaeon]